MLRGRAPASNPAPPAARRRLRLEVKLARRARKPRLLAAMRAMPDFWMELRWELGSSLFGLLLRRYAPSDSYTLHKAGLRLRVDGELRGLDPRSRSVLPRWKRGPFRCGARAACFAFAALPWRAAAAARARAGLTARPPQRPRVVAQPAGRRGDQPSDRLPPGSHRPHL